MITNSGPPLDPVASEPLLLRAHAVMRMMGGGFDFSPEIHGNTFSLYLPAAAGAIVPAPAVAPATTSAPKTILVVEDEPGIRALIRKMLQRRGYEVLEAPSGAEALRTAAQVAGKIDLLITDLIMPNMNGRELVDKVVAARPHIKVLFISGFTDDPLLDRTGLKAGVGFLQKPFTLESLLRSVDEVLNPPRDAQAASSAR
jgi:CheY-like chemotaxis protein